MLPEFWKGLAGELGKRWTAATFYPAFAFWAGGFMLTQIATGRALQDLAQVGDHLRLLPELGQVAVLVGGLLAITASGVFVQTLTFPTLRLLEGYWPSWLNWPRRRIIDIRTAWRSRTRLGIGKEVRYGHLATKRYTDEGLTPAEVDKFGRLDEFYLSIPEDPMPTRLGELLRSAEQRSREKYGLDPIVCWPQLWLVMSGESRREIESARGSLDLAVLLWTWSVLFLAWTPGAKAAAPIGIVLAWYAHRQIRSAAMDYGDLMAASFDVNRFALYDALHWPLPTDTLQEKVSGARLTDFLRRGSGVALPLRHPVQPVGRWKSLLGELRHLARSFG